MYKIILVDDESFAIKSIAKAVKWEKFGFELCGVFTNGFDCLDYIADNDVDAVMSDIRMPQMDGMELSRKILEQKPKVSIVLMSAYKDFEYALQAVRLKVFDYIIKPFDCKTIEGVLQKLRDTLNNSLSGTDREDEVYSVVMAVKKYVEKHIESGISLTEAAEAVSVSPSYLSRIFKDETGEKFLDYVNRRRIEIAQNYLLTTGMKINDIYKKVGYMSRNYFYNMFKSISGCSPNEYREKMRKSR